MLSFLPTPSVTLRVLNLVISPSCGLTNSRRPFYSKSLCRFLVAAATLLPSLPFFPHVLYCSTSGTTFHTTPFTLNPTPSSASRPFCYDSFHPGAFIHRTSSSRPLSSPLSTPLSLLPREMLHTLSRLNWPCHLSATSFTTVFAVAIPPL
jgi:hypothetical protein